MKKSIVSVGVIFLMGCTGAQTPSPASVSAELSDGNYGANVMVEQVARKAPGMVEYIWEEPMVDVVDVPPGLDPEGYYYRPAHQEVIEIRQGRWQYYRDR